MDNSYHRVILLSLFFISLPSRYKYTYKRYDNEFRILFLQSRWINNKIDVYAFVIQSR